MAVIKNKPIAFSLILVCLIVVSPMAKAQLLGSLLGNLPIVGNIPVFGGVGGIIGSVPVVGGVVGPVLNNVIDIPNIQGVVFCTHNGRTSPNTRSTPVFANADVELQCGKQNKVISSTTTNAAGIFSLPTNSIQKSLSTLLSDCKLAVTTPLTNCNSTLPSVGSLVSPLTFVGSTVSSGVINVINLTPTDFLVTG